MKGEEVLPLSSLYPLLSEKENSYYLNGQGGNIIRSLRQGALLLICLFFTAFLIKYRIVLNSDHISFKKSQYNLNLYNVIEMDISPFKINKEDVRKVRVGIIDSGLNIQSSNTNLIFLNKNQSADSKLHGNIVSSIIGARENPYNDFVGFFPNKELYVYDIEDRKSIMNLTEAINTMIDNGIDIINISLSTSKYDENLYLAVNRAIKRGITIIASSGNSGDDANLYPAAFDLPGIISVGATNGYNNILGTSTVNAKVDVWAPGENISAIEDNLRNVEKYSGTSVSTPIVTSLVILLKAKRPELSPEQIDLLVKKGAYEYIGKWGTNNKTIRMVNFRGTLELCGLHNKKSFQEME